MGKMADKQKRLYHVACFNDKELHVYAGNSTQAKRVFCREYGLRGDDAWCGVSMLTARVLNPAEERAWLKQASIIRETYTLIGGMLDIYSKAYE